MNPKVRDAVITGVLKVLALPTTLLILTIRWVFSPSGPSPIERGTVPCGTCEEPIVLARMNTCGSCGFVSASSLVLPCEACGEAPSPYVQCTSCGASNEVRL